MKEKHLPLPEKKEELVSEMTAIVPRESVIGITASDISFSSQSVFSVTTEKICWIYFRKQNLLLHFRKKS